MRVEQPARRGISQTVIGSAYIADIEQLKRLKAEGWGATDIAETLGIARKSVYRALERAAVNK